MSKRKQQTEPPPAEERCRRCDSIIPEGAERCVMCGLPREESAASDSAAAVAPQPVAPPTPPLVETEPGDMVSVVRETKSSFLFWLVAALVAGGLVAGWSALRDQGPTVMAAFIPTTTSLPPTITNTPTWTPLPTEPLPPSATPEPRS